MEIRSPALIYHVRIDQTERLMERGRKAKKMFILPFLYYLLCIASSQEQSDDIYIQAKTKQFKGKTSRQEVAMLTGRRERKAELV